MPVPVYNRDTLTGCARALAKAAGVVLAVAAVITWAVRR